MQLLKCRHYSCFFAFVLLSVQRCGAVPKAIDLLDVGQLDSFKPNYCNDTELMVQTGLLKSPLGQFVGYPCSNEFFHCRWQSDGYRTYKKNCRTGCAITSDTAKCKERDFACPLSEHCVSMGQRCDGKYDCVLEEDEQNCPMCKPSEFACIISEQCIPMSQRCNGVAECQDGTDEHDCQDCGQAKFYCRKSGKCISAKERCDGAAQCPHGEDELLCKKSPYRMFVCESRRHQIPRENLCDGVKNCPDGSDEKYCKEYPPNNSNVRNSALLATSKSENTTILRSIPASFPRVEFIAQATKVKPQKSIAPQLSGKPTTSSPIPLPSSPTAPVFTPPNQMAGLAPLHTNSLLEEDKQAEMVEGDYQTGLGEFSPAFPSPPGQASPCNLTPAVSSDVSPVETVPIKNEGEPKNRLETEKLLPKSEAGLEEATIIELENTSLSPMTTTSLSGVPLTASPVPAATSTASPPPCLVPSTTPSSEELVARGARIPLKKYPFVNPWKATPGSTGSNQEVGMLPQEQQEEQQIEEVQPCSAAPSTANNNTVDSQPTVNLNNQPTVNSNIVNSLPTVNTQEDYDYNGLAEEVATIIPPKLSTVNTQSTVFNQQTVKNVPELTVFNGITTMPPPCVEFPKEAEPKSLEEEKEILRRLSSKYGSGTKDLLRRMEQLLQAQEDMKESLNFMVGAPTTSSPNLSTAQQMDSEIVPDSEAVSATIVNSNLPTKTIRVVSRSPKHRKWQPSLSNHYSAADMPATLSRRRVSKKKGGNRHQHVIQQHKSSIGKRKKTKQLHATRSRHSQEEPLWERRMHRTRINAEE